MDDTYVQETITQGDVLQYHICKISNTNSWIIPEVLVMLRNPNPKLSVQFRVCFANALLDSPHSFYDQITLSSLFVSLLDMQIWASFYSILE